MSETTTKLNPENHLLLDQSLLRLPLELERRNFKKAQTVIDHEQKTTTTLLKEAAKRASSAGPNDTLNSIDAMIARMEKLKRKLQTLHAEEQALHDQSAKRIRHLQELYEIPSLTDVKYETWSRTRLDRLAVDYLLRAGYSDTAAALAASKDIQDLIDLDTFIACHKIANSIQRGDTAEALAWVRDNKESLKKLLEKTSPTISATTITSPPRISPLEFQLRFQEYIELLRQFPHRQTARYEALNYAQKHLYPQSLSHPEQICTVAGLLSQDPSTSSGPYQEYFSPARWTYLSNLFVETHHNLLNLPLRSGLHVALSAGLSALKTPACHSALNPASAVTGTDATFAPTSAKGSHGIGESLCPICSMELNSLALSVPYAHHTKSSVENDPVMLPNGRVYGRERLEELERKKASIDLTMISSVDQINARKGRKVQDPVTGDEFRWDEVKKVYIT